MNTPLRHAPEADAIEKLAHELWIGRGRPEGSAEEDWLRAEQILRIPTLQERTRQNPRNAKNASRVVPDDSCDG